MAALLSMTGVRKHYGAVVALDGVDLEVAAGEVHALIGENGAGKSTLMKVLSGAIRPDAGAVVLAGTPYAPAGPQQARDLGVAMIYQELNLAPDLSVADNVMLGREQHRLGLIDRRRTEQQVAQVLASLDHSEISPRHLIRDLGPGSQQVVELVRALSQGARIVVMDEPTSSLTRADTDRLFAVIDKLRAEGVAVIYISHFLDEVKRVADRYTVLRDGKTVGRGVMSETSIDVVIEQMVGRKISEVFPRVPREPTQPLLTLTALAGRTLPRDVSLTLHRGEILGIAGLVGAGRSELLRAVFGLADVVSGRVRVAALEDAGAPPWVRLAQGVGMLSENRKEEGLALSLSVADNLTLSRLAPCTRLGFVQRARQAALARHWVDRLSIRCESTSVPAAQLSGGNQQKLALARLLHHDVDVLLLDEPTRGVDVGSKAEIYRLMGELAAAGKAILFVSSYVPELLGVCDRISVMQRGVLGSPRAAAQWTEASILEEAARGSA